MTKFSTQSESRERVRDLMSQFQYTVNTCPDLPTHEQWTPVRKLYARLMACLSPDQQRQLWAQVKTAKAEHRANGTESPYLAFAKFSRVRTALYHQTPKAKAKRAEYDRKAKQSPKRQAQIKEAKARHRAKKPKTQLPATVELDMEGMTHAYH